MMAGAEFYFTAYPASLPAYKPPRSLLTFFNPSFFLQHTLHLTSLTITYLTRFFYLLELHLCVDRTVNLLLSLPIPFSTRLSSYSFEASTLR